MLDFYDFATLAHGLPSDWLCAHLDITPQTLRAYRRGARPIPKPIMELLKFIQWGELSAIGGTEWEGFTLRCGTLSMPFFPRGFTSHQLKGMFFTTQDAWALRADLAHAHREIARLTDELQQERARKRAKVRIEIDGETVYGFM